MRRTNALPDMLVDFTLVASLATAGMLIVFVLLYVTTALGAIDPLLF